MADRWAVFVRFLADGHGVSKVKQLWQCDSKYGYVVSKQCSFFGLAFIDVFTRKVVGVHVGLRRQSGDLCRTLADSLLSKGIEAGHGLVIRTDNEPQMTAEQVSAWLSTLEQKLEHEFIPIRAPNKNAHIEPVSSILEFEFLGVTYFRTFADAYEKTHAFIRFYSVERIHSAIGDINPAEAGRGCERGEELNIKSVSM